MVRTRLPPDALCAVWAVPPADSRSSLVFSPLAANAAGAVRRQPKMAAGKMAWRVRILYRGGNVSPDQAQVPYRQGASRYLNVDFRADD